MIIIFKQKNCLNIIIINLRNRQIGGLMLPETTSFHIFKTIHKTKLSSRIGFGFLRTPFVVSGSLNGYKLETDPVVPSHAPIFDAELVWEADKRRFRSLRVQNVPVKVEVYTTCTQGRKDKVGYLLLSLLSAQPCPANKIVDLKYTTHRLLGVKSEGKCCHPQLLMSLSIEDRVSTPTPRNELRLFHSNEIAYPVSSRTTGVPTARSMAFTMNEFILESKKTVTSSDLQPKLLCDEGLIQIGNGSDLFVLSLVIGVVENIDLLLPENCESATNCYITYSVFTHNIMTDRVSSSKERGTMSAHFNQRTSLRLATHLTALARYFTECPYLIAKVCHNNTDVGVCSMDLRKLIPTDDINNFIDNFCNGDRALTIDERCYILRCDDTKRKDDGRKPFVDIEMSLKYCGVKNDTQKPKVLTARSVSHLQSDRKAERMDSTVEYRSGSCTDIHTDVGGVAYTNIDVRNTARYKNASGDAMLQTNEIAEMIKKMYDSFAQSQERILARTVKPTTSDIEVQCEQIQGTYEPEKMDGFQAEREPVVLETSKSDTYIRSPVNKDMVKSALSQADRDVIMRRFVDELEDWKEKQQELYKLQLRRKEEYHLELLAKEWAKQRVELECKLSRGIDQCRSLASDLSRATEDFRLRGYRNTEREKKLLEAKKALESHYTAKYQELREASLKMEDDMNHQLKIKDMRIEELELKVMQLEKQVDVLKNNMKNAEKEAEKRYSGLTKDQTASLIQELRCLEEKLDSAVQSKAFFKEQWSRAVRELHLLKLNTRKLMLSQLQHDRRELGDVGEDEVKEISENKHSQDRMDISKLKDNFYVDILANTPALETDSFITSSGPGVMEMFDDIRSVMKNPANEKLNKLISQRDRIIQDDNPNEDLLKQLNQEIRSMLLNCGT